MISTLFFILATLLLSLNLIRPFGLAISDWLYFCALIIAFFETIIQKRSIYEWINKKFLWPVFFITLGGIISLANSRKVPVAIGELIQQLYVLTVFISLIRIMVKRGKTEIIISAFILSGVFSSVIAEIDYFLGTTYGPVLSQTPQIQLWGRYAGTLGHPNKFGYFLVLTTLLSFYKLTKDKKKGDLVVLLAILVQIFGIYLSGSITAYLGILVGGFYLLYCAVSSKIRYLFLILGLILLLMVLIINVLLIDSVFHQTWGIGQRSLIGVGINRVLNLTSKSRIDLYKQSIDYIFKSPVIGAGFDQVSTSGIAQEIRALPGSIHNLLLQVWYIGGISAFIGWLSVYFYIGKITIENLFRKNQYQASLFNALSAATVSIISMDQIQDAIYQRDKWLVIGLFVSWAWIVGEKKKIH